MSNKFRKYMNIFAVFLLNIIAIIAAVKLFNVEDGSIEKLILTIELFGAFIAATLVEIKNQKYSN